MIPDFECPVFGSPLYLELNASSVPTLPSSVPNPRILSLSGFQASAVILVELNLFQMAVTSNVDLVDDIFQLKVKRIQFKTSFKEGTTYFGTVTI